MKKERRNETDYSRLSRRSETSTSDHENGKRGATEKSGSKREQIQALDRLNTKDRKMVLRRKVKGSRSILKADTERSTHVIKMGKFKREFKNNEREGLDDQASNSTHQYRRRKRTPSSRSKEKRESTMALLDKIHDRPDVKRRGVGRKEEGKNRRSWLRKGGSYAGQKGREEETRKTRLKMSVQHGSSQRGYRGNLSHRRRRPTRSRRMAGLSRKG